MRWSWPFVGSIRPTHVSTASGRAGDTRNASSSRTGGRDIRSRPRGTVLPAASLTAITRRASDPMTAARERGKTRSTFCHTDGIRLQRATGIDARAARLPTANRTSGRCARSRRAKRREKSAASIAREERNGSTSTSIPMRDKAEATGPSPIKTTRGSIPAGRCSMCVRKESSAPPGSPVPSTHSITSGRFVTVPLDGSRAQTSASLAKALGTVREASPVDDPRVAVCGGSTRRFQPRWPRRCR